MAYDSDDFLVTAKGNLMNGEVWANTWCVKRIDVGATIASLVAQIRGFYNDLLAYESNEWSFQHADVKQLSTGVVIPALGAAFSGSSTDSDLPPEVAVRLSLDDGLGVRGGPFLAGFTTHTLGVTGNLDTTFKEAVAGAADALANALLSNGWQLCINRPTVPRTVFATRARVGEIFDVIRRRRDTLMESYAVVDLPS